MQICRLYFGFFKIGQKIDMRSSSLVAEVWQDSLSELCMITIWKDCWLLLCLLSCHLLTHFPRWLHKYRPAESIWNSKTHRYTRFPRKLNKLDLSLSSHVSNSHLINHAMNLASRKLGSQVLPLIQSGSIRQATTLLFGVDSLDGQVLTLADALCLAAAGDFLKTF